MNVAGFRKQTTATKKGTKEENESGSDYEQVPEHQEPKWKTKTLPAKLTPASPSTNTLCIRSSHNQIWNSIQCNTAQNNSEPIMLLNTARHTVLSASNRHTALFVIQTFVYWDIYFDYLLLLLFHALLLHPIPIIYHIMSYRRP